MSREILQFPMQQQMKIAVGAENLAMPQQLQPNLQPAHRSDEVLPDNMTPFSSRQTSVHDIVNFRDASFAAFQAAKAEREARGEVKEREYGAFIQIQVKDGDNISYRSLGLPRGTTSEMVQKMMRITSNSEATPKTFDDGKLAVLSQIDVSGAVDAADRMVEAAFQVVREDHPDQNDTSVRKFYEKYPLIKKELRETGGRFGKYLTGPAKARIADGRHIHHGSYMMEGETATGLDINGQPWDIATIARDQGHKDQMGEVVSIFKNNKKVVVFVGDNSGSVGECKEACADYYEWKEGAHNGSLMQEVYSTTTTRSVDVFNGYISKYDMSKLCSTCFKEECACSAAEEASGGE